MPGTLCYFYNFLLWFLKQKVRIKKERLERHVNQIQNKGLETMRASRLPPPPPGTSGHASPMGPQRHGWASAEVKPTLDPGLWTETTARHGHPSEQQQWGAASP